MTSFIIKKNATTWWPVKWQEPVDGGGVEEASIEVQFVRIAWDDREAAYAMGNLEFIKHVGRDWRGIADEAKRPVPFTDEHLTEMCGRPKFAEAIGAAYIEFLLAMPETRQGNFDPSPDGGPAAGAKTADQADTAMP